MSYSTLRLLTALASAFMLSCLLTGLSIRLFSRWGWVARARDDRWHRGSPCLFGGVPLWIAFITAAVLTVPFSNGPLWKLVAVASAVFVLGLVDDIFNLAPRRKLLLQVLATACVLASGAIYPFRASLVVNIFISAVWILGITNAFNLLDNMDGLSAGIALIASAYLAAILFTTGPAGVAVAVLCLAGAIAGFLVFNFNPARIFMGDAGSLFLGFALASFSLLNVTHLSGMSSLLLIPVLVMAIPILDTTAVSISRKLRGQPVSQGGTDHTSHRLVRLGLGDRGAVLLLYALAIASGAVALVLRRLPNHAIAIVGFWFLLLVLFGIQVFQPATHAGKLPIREGLAARLLHRDAVVWLLDPAILLLSFYSACVIRFYGASHVDYAIYQLWLPAAVGMKLLALASFGVYKRSWWRPGPRDAWNIFVACATGEALVVVVLVFLTRFTGYARVVFALDFVISSAVLVLVRHSSAAFAHIMQALKHHTRGDVLILGADAPSHAAIHLVHAARMNPIGVVDLNHGSDLGKFVWGFPVVGHISRLSELTRIYSVKCIVMPSDTELPIDVSELQRICRERGIRLVRVDATQFVKLD